MSTPIKVVVTVTQEVEVTIEQIASWFAAMDDDQQAKFFVEVAKIAQSWKDPGMQWWLVGSHLRNCECSTEDARELVRTLYAGLERGSH